MSINNITQQLNRILCRLLQSEEININPATSLSQDLGLDSLLFIELVAMIETEFQFAFDNEYLLVEKIDKICDLVIYISKKVEQNEQIAST